MPNKLSVGLAVSLLLTSTLNGLALADDATSALEKQIMNGEASPSAGNPDNIPWMNKDGSVKPSDNKEVPMAKPVMKQPPSTTEAVPPAPTESVAPAKIPDVVREATPKVETRTEHERAAAEKGHATESRTLEKERPVEARPVEAAQPAAAKKTMLFGRIEQLVAGKGAAFPELKAQTPKMDTSLMQGKVAENKPLQGSVVQSFPVNYEGNWGGRLVLQNVQVDPNYYNIDPEEARRTAQAMRVGSIGAINFMFDRTRGKIDLAPSRCLFMVPAGDTQVPDEMKRMLGNSGGTNAAFGGIMSQMVGSMPVPIVLEFGEVQTGAGETSVSGNQMRQRVMKNEVRQLAANVLEQQIVTQETTWDKRTGKARTGYGESVVRFTRQAPTTLYVQCATVSYGADRKFLAKMVLYGSVGKGVVMNTDPMQAMTQSMGGMPGMGGGMGGLGALGNMFGGSTPQPGQGQQMPQIPGMGGAGGMEGMLKNLFGGQ